MTKKEISSIKKSPNTLKKNSEIQLHLEQLLQNTYWMLAEDLRPPRRQETPHVHG